MENIKLMIIVCIASMFFSDSSFGATEITLNDFSVNIFTSAVYVVPIGVSTIDPENCNTGNTPVPNYKLQKVPFTNSGGLSIPTPNNKVDFQQAALLMAYTQNTPITLVLSGCDQGRAAIVAVKLL